MKQTGWRPWRPAERRRRSESRPLRIGVVDPGSSLLRMAVAGLGGEQPIVWGWHERPTPEEVASDAERLTRDCAQCLERAEQMAEEHADGWRAVDQMVVGLPAANVRGWSWPVTQRRSQPERAIEERELETLLARALRLTVNRLREPEEPDWLLLEAVPVLLTVDGRRVTDPIGFRGEEMSAGVFAALAHRSTVELWRQVAERLDLEALTLTATPLALATCLAESQALTLDIGGATTSLTWSRAGRPVATHFVPMGGASLTQLLQRKWGLSSQRAEALKHAYASGKLTTQARNQVGETIAPAIRTWLDLLEGALAVMSERADEALPHQLYMCGGASVVAEMEEAARSLAWSRRLAFDRYPQVGRLQPTDVPGVVNRTEAGRGSGDVAALSLVTWASRQTGELSRPEHILRRLSEA